MPCPTHQLRKRWIFHWWKPGLATPCSRARRGGALNPMGTVHGGWFATLLDSALGCAVHTRMKPGQGYTTAELSVNIVRALTPKVTRVRA